MNIVKTSKIIGLSLSLCAVSATALGAEMLVSEKSAIRFISVKNASVAEVHHFGKLTGRIDDNGNVSVTVPLVEVETMIPIRNERMRKLLFEVDTFPSAEISATVDMKKVNALKNGDYLTLDLAFTLDLHGARQEMSAPVSVARLGDDIHVATIKPLVINVADFKLTDGVEQLRTIAGLKSISTAVPVTAELVFSR